MMPNTPTAPQMESPVRSTGLMGGGRGENSTQDSCFSPQGPPNGFIFPRRMAETGAESQAGKGRGSSRLILGSRSSTFTPE